MLSKNAMEKTKVKSYNMPIKCHGNLPFVMKIVKNGILKNVLKKT